MADQTVPAAMTRASVSGARRVGYVRILIDDLFLLLDWSDVRSVEYPHDLASVAKDAASAEPVDDAGVWQDALGGPLVVLDANLQARFGDWAAHSACVLVDAASARFGILCDHVDVVRGDAVRLYPVPSCIADRTLPLAAIAQVGECIGFVAHARRLAARVARART